MAATPTRMSASDRRNQLLDVAIDLFSRKGFGGAAAAGVTEAIIFRHFATKQDLYKAILDTRCADPIASAWFAEARQFMENNDDAGLFRALVATIVKCKREDPRFERLMLHAALEGHELAIMHHNQLAMPIGEKFKAYQFTLPIGKQLIDYIAKRQAEGAIRKFDPAAVLFAVAGVAQFYASQKYLYQCADIPLSDDAIIDAFLAILMKGLQK